jgi:hypothetical protein
LCTAPGAIAAGGAASAATSSRRTGAAGGRCAGCANGGTVSTASALFRCNIGGGGGAGAMGCGAGGATAGAAGTGASTDCSCGNGSGAAAAGGTMCTGWRLPFRRRLTLGYWTGAATCTLSGASMRQKLASVLTSLASGSKLTG